MQAATSIAIDPSKKIKAKELLDDVDAPTRLGGEPIPEKNLLRDQLLMNKLRIATSGPGSQKPCSRKLGNESRHT